MNGTDQEEIRTGEGRAVEGCLIYCIWLYLVSLRVYLYRNYLFCAFFAGVDQCIQRFLDVARQTECFFLQKRLQLSVQKPEQVVKEVMYSTHLQRFF